MKGIYFGSYWMAENDVVFLMAKALEKLCDLDIVDTKIYDISPKKWYIEDFSVANKWPVRWLDQDKVAQEVLKHNPDFIVVNSGGMSLTRQTSEFLKSKKITTVGISLSDPDVFYDNGRIYSSYFDLFYTNSKFALDNLYPKIGNAKLMPFAALPDLHKPMDIEKKYDVVVVGHAKPDRKKIIGKLAKKFKVGLFGAGWGRENSEVHGLAHIQAINSGKIYLSFAKTMASYVNVKVGLFEAMACKTCVAVQSFNEIDSYFKPGLEILTYNNISDLENLIGYYTQNDRVRNWIAENGYVKLLLSHTWEKRWETVLKDIQNFKNE